MRFLRKRLEGMVVVEQRPADPRRVFFGAWVLLEADDGGQERYRIVGPDEFDMGPGYISMDSPLGRALLTRGLDDQVTLEAPGGSRILVIVGIEYESARERRYQMTLTFLNCQGSVLSRSSVKSRSRSCSGVHSVYSPTTGPR